MPLTDKQQRDLLLLTNYSLWTSFSTPSLSIAQRFLRLQNTDCDLPQVFSFLIGPTKPLAITDFSGTGPFSPVHIFLYDLFEFLKLQTKKEDDYLSITYPSYIDLVLQWEVINDGKLTDDEQAVLNDIMLKKFSHKTN